MQNYVDFDLEITEPERDAAGVESLRIQVASSPAGEQRRDEAPRVNLGETLRSACGRLDRRELNLEDLIAVGRGLGEVLFPEPVRRYLKRSLDELDENEGLRIRLKLDTWGMADLPWEYCWLPEEGDPEQPADATGFLVLDPRISIVRYELLSEPIGDLEPEKDRKFRLVAMFAAPKDPRWAPLDLIGEESGLETALANRREIDLNIVTPATLAGLQGALLEGAQVFHFAGHGRFQAAIEDPIGTVAGKGFLVFCDDEGKATEVSAETVVVNLHGRGVRLAVLGACEGARRDRFNPWTGIAPALVRGGLPAVVAMQATLYDRSAVAFSKRFYEALALGKPIDAAVAAGRIAIFNESGPGERDWGVPVLYLRAKSGILFPKATVTDGSDKPPEPLGRRGCINAGLVALAFVALFIAFHAYAQPRFASRWLWGGGLSFAGVGAAVLAWIHWLAGAEVRAWTRSRLSHLRTTIVLATTLFLALILMVVLFKTSPVVLRVVPGTKLTAHLQRDESEFSLRIWQGQLSNDPDWTVIPLVQSGAVLGSSQRVIRLAMSRANQKIETVMLQYLGNHDVPERQRTKWMERWQHEIPTASNPGKTVRRRTKTIHMELLKGNEVIEIRPLEIKRVEEIEDNVELVFIEPATDL